MTTPDIVVPIKTADTDGCVLTPLWFVQCAEFHPCQATYKPLVNGEEAFAAVYHAIANAQKSVDIICWGFQPSMYFVRDGKSPCIGELLVKLAREKNVEVRVLGWEMPLNAAGLGGEANLPGKGAIRIKDRAGQSATDEQYAYDRDWFSKYSLSGEWSDHKLRNGQAGIAEIAAAPANRRAEKLQSCNPLFVGRGFDGSDRAEIMYQAALNSVDKDISAGTVMTLGSSATHHQKTVLVDYELPEAAVDFVMGHNMLDEYWDTDDHSSKFRGDDKVPPNMGPRGKWPRQDMSSLVTGPVLEHLHQNFATAWQRETGQDLIALRNAKAVAKELKPRPGFGTPVMAQILRTQAQEERRDIEKLYLQNVNNATQFIYIENQYFRWPPLAEAIKKAAQTQVTAGRTPEKDGSLHVFVVTNVTDEAIGSGTLNTQRMLDSLGRSDTISGVVKMQQITRLIKSSSDQPVTYVDPAKSRNNDMELSRKIKEIDESKIFPEDRPGLKIHVCSLVAKDSPPHDWMPIYVHSKVMIINDVFMTNGSANINTRSMQVDSEMNIAHEWAGVTQSLRRRLWNMHTAGLGAQDDPEDAFDVWEKLLNRNSSLQRSEKSSPEAPVIKFNYTQYKITDLA
ncbi:phospholipase D-like domain-containing protein [Cronobacter turicensis]|nr:phospholipase [Cronobacter turicensis]